MDSRKETIVVRGEIFMKNVLEGTETNDKRSKRNVCGGWGGGGGGGGGGGWVVCNDIEQNSDMQQKMIQVTQ